MAAFIQKNQRLDQQHCRYWIKVNDLKIATIFSFGILWRENTPISIIMMMFISL